MAQATLALDMVKCVDETGGSFRENFGNDEIYLAAVGIDSQGVVKVPFFEVGGNFDDGEVNRFSPARNLATLAADGNCSAVLLLAERQHGGMNDALDAAFTKVAEQLALARAKADGAGTEGGSTDAGDAGIGAVIAAITKELIAFLIKESKDKVFPPQIITLGQASGEAEFRGHDGVYRVGYHWDVAA